MDLKKDIKEAKFLGHPIHMMLIHFPVGLLPFSVIFDLMAVIYKNSSFAMTGLYMLTTGLWLGAGAAVFGMIDFIRIPERKERARSKGVIHMILNMIWMSVFAVIWGLRVKGYPAVSNESTAELIMSALSVLMMLVSNHFGGEMVLKEGIGTDNLIKAEEAEESSAAYSKFEKSDIFQK
ncbi:MAG TPA: DUF2231 domain-containing protein [Ignavibacteriales bacterium]|nr:DUF2231 domain-containing protein [Ignavibacteriales bacterium]